MTNKKYYSIDEITDVVIKAIKEVKTDSKLLKDNEILARLEDMGRKGDKE